MAKLTKEKEKSIMAELNALIQKSIKTTIKPQKMVHKITGEISTSIPLMDIKNWRKK